jgi:formylglycine-generating enzyme required for sulfatase activity/type II secretory pathway pseudopilin PulG
MNVPSLAMEPERNAVFPRSLTQRGCSSGLAIIELLIVVALIASLAGFLLPALINAQAAASSAKPVDVSIFSAGTNGVRTSWNATPGRSYFFQSTTNLSAPWRDVLPAPGTLTASTNFLSQIFTTGAPARFFRVLKADTAGPDVYRVEPGAGGIAVARQAALRVWMRDDSDIATNSLRLAITNRPPLALGDPRLRFANGVLTYTPGTNEILGVAGEVVTVSFSAADILGNQTTNFTWSFQLELPVVSSTNLVFIGGGGAQPSTPMLLLLSTNGNTFIYSYAGGSSGLAQGQFLVDTNLATGYTRAVVSFTENAVSRTVAVVTRPAKLAELLQQGSFSSAILTEIGPPSPGPPAQGMPPSDVLATGLVLDFNFNLAQTFFKDAALSIELLPGSFLNWSGQLDLGLNIRNFQLREFETKFSGAAGFRFEARANASGALDRALTNALINPVHRLFGGFVGAVPVWVEVVYEINVLCDLHLDGKANYRHGQSGSNEILVRRRWKEAEGWTASFENPLAAFTVLGPAWEGETTGNFRVSLQPKVTAYISSTAGVSLDLQPFAQLNGRVQVNPREWELALYGGLRSSLGLDLRGWDGTWGEVPSAAFDLIPRMLLWYTNTLAGAPRITGQPQSQPVPLNDAAILSVEAIGETPLSYRWLKNGLVLGDDFLISGSRTPFLRVRNVKAFDEGDYQVEISNAQGRVLSARARVQVYYEAAPPGMVKIPAGTFVMGSPTTEKERFADENQHAVTLAKDFYMSKYEVTQREYLAVMGNNPSFFTTKDGNGKPINSDLNRPVEQVSWNDATNYCGKLAAAERVAGRLLVGWEYRLPTEAEWEYACRAGTGTTFYNGNELRSGMANFDGHYEYPPGPGESAYHYNPGGAYLARTTAVGGYVPNAFGLYDMHGNVWEWCLDWYGVYPGGTVTDPRGPLTATLRVFRGGSWSIYAGRCRSASRYFSTLDFRTYYLGFRPVLAPVR